MTVGPGALRPSKKRVVTLTVSCLSSELTGPCAGTLTLKSAGKLRVGLNLLDDVQSIAIVRVQLAVH